MSVHIVCKDALTNVPGETTEKLETIHLSAFFSSMFGSFDMFHWSLYVWLIDGNGWVMESHDWFDNGLVSNKLTMGILQGDELTQ